MRRVLSTLLLLLVAAGPAVLADAPESGTVNGTITDASGTPLPGVNVTISGERGDQFTVTEADGTYRFALLVPGAYKVTAELEGLGSAKSDVNVRAGGRESIDLTLKAATEETITVTSEAPMVDKFNVTAGTTVSAEIGTQTAGTTRTYYGVINALPGVTADAENDDIQQTRPSVNGTHFADNAVYIDGVDTTFAKFGGSRVFLPTSAVTEVSMEAGGSSAEYGRVIGSSTNVIVKSGTNNYHFDALVQYQRVDWGSDYKDQPSLANREENPLPVDTFKRTPAENDGNSTSFETTFGGPIKRDKAWIFLGLTKEDDAYLEHLLPDATPDGQGGTQLWEDPVDTSLDTDSYIFKVNFQPTTAHSLSASYVDTPAKRIYFNPNSADLWTPTPHDVTGDLATINWNYSISSSLFLETKVATQTSTEDKQLACGTIDVPTCLAQKQQDPRFPPNSNVVYGPQAGGTQPGNAFWPGNNYFVYEDNEYLSAWHNGWILSDGFGYNEFPRTQGNAGLTQFVGSNHELKYGLDYQQTKWEGQNYRTGYVNMPHYSSFNYFGSDGAGGFGPETCGFYRTGAAFELSPLGRANICTWVDYNADVLTSNRGSGDAEMNDTALYVRDRFTIGDHWTFNIGLRAEQQTGYNDVRRKVVDDNYVDPRIAVTYDVNGDGKLLFNLNAGNYHAMLNQAWIAGGGGTAGGMHDKWNGYEGQVVYLFCDPLDVSIGGILLALGFGDAEKGSCLDGVGYNMYWQTLEPGLMWDFVDAGIWNHDIDTYYKEEVIVGMEWQFSRNWALDVKYIDWRLEDMMFSHTQYDHLGRNVFLTENYKDLPDIVRALTAARVANGLSDLGITDELVDSFQPAHNSYRGLQIQANKRFSNGWAVYNNVSFSETDTTGSGAWWNNTNSTYGENMATVLTAGQIDICQAEQSTRTYPVDCHALLDSHVGEIASTVNRRGLNGNNDRDIIFNSFGFKTWRFGSQDFTLGGHLTYQTGTPWQRSEGVTTINTNDTTGNRPSNTGTTLVLWENQDGYRTSDEYTLNMSGAWGHKITDRLHGELRVEVLNLTDQQKQRSRTGRGEVYPVRRFFQRPRQVRMNYKISW